MGRKRGDGSCHKESKGVDGHSGGTQHYVVTEDVRPLMEKWGERKKFTVPDKHWFAANHQLLRSQLESSLNGGREVVIVDSVMSPQVCDEMHPLIYSLIGDKIDFDGVVAVDTVYVPHININAFSLEINRTVDIHGRDLGRMPRPGALTLDQQIQGMRKENRGINSNVVVIDDGIWTGRTMEMVFKLLKRRGFNVVGAILGVNIEKRREVNLELETGNFHYIQHYGKDSRPVKDWVCERDFILGVPYGGRTVMDKGLEKRFPSRDGRSIGAFYAEGHDWLRNWASINNGNGKFSSFCFDRSVAMFEEIEKLSSGRRVLVKDLDRLPLCLAKQPDITPDCGVVTRLKRAKAELVH